MSNDNRTLATIKIEWNLDMVWRIKSTDDSKSGDDECDTVKGRCKRCWGRLIGRADENHEVTGIKCVVCGKTLEGEEAKLEHKKIMEEALSNLWKMRWGQVSTCYGDGPFIGKIFPWLDRMTTQEIKRNIRIKAIQGKKKSFLTRDGFPAGSPGYLLMQARILMAGIEDASNPGERSVVDFSKLKFNADGSATVYVSKDGISDDPQYSEYRLQRKMGTTMNEAMMSAFACELAMKAICLTRRNESPKSHDLIKLYDYLPHNSRRRINADFPNIRSVLDNGRQTFGKWRYFETNINKQAMLSMIETLQARELGKAARVILDEGELVGLGFSVSMDATENVTIDEQIRRYDYRFDLNVKGTENPPWDDGD